MWTVHSGVGDRYFAVEEHAIAERKRLSYFTWATIRTPEGRVR